MALPVYKSDDAPTQLSYTSNFNLIKDLTINEDLIPFLDYNVILKHTIDNISPIAAFVNESDSGYWLPLNWSISWGSELVYYGPLSAADGIYFGTDGTYEYYTLYISEFYVPINPERHPHCIDPGPIAFTQYVSYNGSNVIQYKINVNNVDDIRLITPEITWSGTSPAWEDTITLTHNIPDLEWITNGIDAYEQKPDSYILIKANDRKYRLVANGSKLLVSSDIVVDDSDTYATRTAAYSKHTVIYDDSDPEHVIYRTYYTEDTVTDGTKTKRTWKVNVPQKPKFKLIVAIRNILGFKEENNNEL